MALILKIKKQNYHMTQELHFWVFIQQNWKQSPGDICTHVFPAALFTIAKSNPNVYQQMSKQNMIIHTMITQYDSALKRKGILSHTTTWMNPDDTTLSKMCHKKIKRLWFHLYEVIQSSQIHGNRAQNGAHQRLREGERRFQILYTV